MEPNRRGFVGDTVLVRFGNESYFEDLGNIKYDGLTFIEAPGERWTMPQYGDPSWENDTTAAKDYSEGIYDFTFDPTDISIVLVNDSLQEPLQPQQQFTNYTRGAGLTDSILTQVNKRIAAHVRKYIGRAEPYEAREDLRSELSMIDSVIENESGDGYVGSYDYLVDMSVAYNYDKGRLLNIVGYHWNYGCEFDSLRYDRKGRIVYYSREMTGFARNEYHFTYNRKGQVELVESRYIGFPDESVNYGTAEHTETVKFTYTKKGILNSRSQLNPENGTWLTVYYEMSDQSIVTSD